MVDQIPDLAPGEAALVDWTAAEYHADRRCVSNSRLGLLSKSPAMLRAVDAGQVPAPLRKSTEFGTHVHLAVLEPMEWARRLAPPRDHANTTAWARRMFGRVPPLWPSTQAEWNARRESIMRRQTDPIDIPDEQAAKVALAANAVLSDPDARDLLTSPDGASEQTVIWRPADFPMLLVRCRIDRLTIGGITIVADLKTTRDPEPEAFGRSVANFGYHRQGAIYTDAVRALPEVGPDASAHFVIVAVRNDPPFEPAVYELEAEELHEGRKAYRKLLADYAERIETNNWTAPWQGGIKRLTLPRWAYTREA